MWTKNMFRSPFFFRRFFFNPFRMVILYVYRIFKLLARTFLNRNSSDQNRRNILIKWGNFPIKNYYFKESEHFVLHAYVTLVAKRLSLFGVLFYKCGAMMHCIRRPFSNYSRSSIERKYLGMKTFSAALTFI